MDEGKAGMDEGWINDGLEGYVDEAGWLAGLCQNPTFCENIDLTAPFRLTQTHFHTNTQTLP